MDLPRRLATSSVAGAVVGIFVVRHLVDEPVLAEVAFADGELDIVREELRVVDVLAPVLVVVALQELRRGAVGDANLPELLSIAHRHPLQLA